MQAASSPTRRVQQRGKEGRARILQNTLELVEAYGYEGATISELAKRTDLPASSIYWHFANKDALVAAAIADSSERWGHEADWPPEPDGRPVVDQLETALRKIVVSKSDADWTRVGLTVTLPLNSRAKSARTVFLDFRSQARARLIAWWRLALPKITPDFDERVPEVMARMTMSVLDGSYLSSEDPRAVPVPPRLYALILVGMAEFLTDGGPVPSLTSPIKPAEVAPWTDEETSRDRLVRATISVLVDRGYPGTTVSRICQKAGLPASSLYWHFEDLDDLVAASIQQAFSVWRSAQQTLREPSDSGASDLASDLNSGLTAMVQHPEAFLIGFGLLLRREDSKGRQSFQEIRHAVAENRANVIIDWLKQECPDVAEPGELANQLSTATMSMADGLFIIETFNPRWALTDAGGLLMAGFRYAVHRWVADAAA